MYNDFVMGRNLMKLLKEHGTVMITHVLNENKIKYTA